MDGPTVTIPDAHLLFSGDFERSGVDLIISDHLHRVVVLNYFSSDKRPALVSAQGAPLDPKFIDALTGHVQYAQVAGTAAAGKVVGHVVKMTGSASIVRNGVTIDVNNGDNVYQNDLVQTGSGSTLGLVMIDGTTFNLTANARLMMNDLTYDATSTSNTSLFTLVQGAATFVAGQVAKTGDMKVSTPVATMGIRGTAVILDISSTDGTVSVSVVNQRDGQVHSVQVLNARGDLIGTVTSNGSVLTLNPTATFEVIAQESNKTVAQVLAEFNAFQQLLSTYDIGKQLVPNTPAPTDGRRGDNGQQPLTKFAGSTISPIDSTTTKFNADIAGTKDVKGGGDAADAATLKPTGDGTGLVTKVAVSVGDAPVQFVEVAATSTPFVVTPSPVSRISSGPGDHFGPVMSADGQFVTYDPDGAIYLFDRLTGATKTIASPEQGLTYGSPTISSDGHFVVYQGSDGTQSWIFIYNNDASDTAHYGQITRLMTGGQAAISGDGSKLVVERGGSIALYDQQGHELASFTAAAIGTTGTLWKPAISADGHIIAFWNSDSASPGAAGKLFTYDLSSATLRSIANTATDAGNSAASFSADGHYVVYQSDAPGGHSEIYLYDVRAGAVVFHTANPEASYNPVLSPDGHFIILASDARLTADDKNAVADVYVIDVTDPSHPVYKLVSVLDDGTQGDAASDLGAAISAGGQFIAFGSRASNFSTGDGPGTGDIFVVDPTSGHSAIILESRNSPAVLTTSGIIKLTGEHNGITLGVSDSRITASFDSHGDIHWSFSEPRSDFASLAPGQISVQNFVITLSTDRSTTEIPLKVSIYDVDQTVVPVADAAPVASPITLAAGTEDTGYTITSAALLAGVVDIDGPSLSISAVGIVSGGGGIVDNHDGSFSYTPAPNYNGPVVFSYTASDGTLSASSTATLNLASVNDAPSVTKANFAVSEGGTVVLRAANIGAGDPDSTSFAFTVSNVTHGKFQATADGNSWSDATTFTSADLIAGHVRFVHDGGEAAPAFSIQADDGEALNHLSATAAGTVDFTNVNDAPTVTAASLTVAEGGTVVLDAANIGVSDPDSTSFTFTVSNVSHGTFQSAADGITWIDATTFTTADVAAGHVRFVHDGGEDAPTFSIQADDGTGVNSLSNVLAGTVDFTNINDAPTITAAQLAISEGGTVVLSAANIGVTDPDDSSFVFIALDVSHGTFQTTTDGTTWAEASTFTTGDLDAGHVRFVHDGGEDAPTFSVQAYDSAGGDNSSNVFAGTVDFSNINDAPTVTAAQLSISEGGTVVLNSTNIGVTDPDDSSFVFIALDVSHGTFQTTTDGTTWVDAGTFTTADLEAGHVRFVHDGGEDAPTFSIQAYDSAGGDNLSNVLAGTVDFSNVNDAPSITTAELTIAEGETVVLTAANIGVTDPDDSSFVFIALDVSHGTFQTTTDGTTWVDAGTFTTGDLDAGHVRFVHDGGADAPTFSIQAYDSAGGDNLSNVLAGTVDFTNVDDAPAGTDNSVTTLENTPYTFKTSDFGFSDPNDSAPNSLLAVKIASLSGGGRLEDNGVAVAANQFVSANDIASGLLKFIPAAGASGANYASFTFQVQDDGGTDNGGINLDQSPNAMTLNVMPVNHAPVAVPDSGVSITQNGGVELSFSPILNASATPVSGEYVITQAINGQVGALWSDSKVSLNTSFSISAELFFGSKDSDGADGFSFIIQNQSKTVTGQAGGGLGYQGLAHSVGIEFDTYDNGSPLDIANDHAAFHINGSMDNLAAPIDLGNIEDGQYHPVTIDWNAATHVITLSYNGTVIGSQTIDVAATVGSNEAYVGFAGSTGALNNLQKIRNLSYQSADSSVVLDVLANDTDVDPGDKATLHVVSATSTSGASLTFSGLAGAGIVYSSGDVFKYLAAGEKAVDTVTYTIEDSHGAPSQSTAEVTIVGIDDAPVFSGTAVGTAFAANGSPVAVVTNVIAFDVDSDYYDGGSLTATVTDGSHSGDTLSIATTPFISVVGNTVMFDSDGAGSAQGPVMLGTLTSNFNTLTVTLNSNASNAAVEALTEAIRFENTAQAPTSDTRTVTFTLRDGGGTANGGHDSTYFATTVAVTAPGLPPNTADVTVSGTEDVSKPFSLASSGPDARGFVFDSVPGDTIGAIHYTDTSSHSGTAVAGVEYAIGTSFTFVPASNWNGSAVVHYHAVGTSGVADPTPNDLTFQFSAVNDAPVITSDGGGATASIFVAENTKAVTTVHASDVDSTDLTYSIVPGIGSSDASSFSINRITGALAFINAPDFEKPGDSNHNNTYTVQVKVSDGDLSDTQTIFVHVTDVNERPHAADDIVITNNVNGSTYQIPDWALLANDTDPDDNALSLTAITASSEFASIDLTAHPGNVTIHDLFVGGSFTYSASDGLLTDTAHVTVTQDTGTMNGGFGNEIFIGDANGTTINANGGNDILIGNAGNDTLNGGSGNDTYVFGLHDGQDVIHDTSGLDTIRIEAGGAALSGLSFAENTTHDLVIQFDGQQVTVDDHFMAEENVGGLRFDGGAHYDGYSLGSDLYFLSNDGGSSRVGNSGNDILSGDRFANNLSGGDGNDLLFGNAGNDTLNGGAGNDLLVGGTGNDLLTGGANPDTFVFASGSGHDTVSDFVPGQDHISLDYAAFDANDPGSFTAWLRDHASSLNDDSDVLIDLNVDGAHPNVDTILLKNVALGNLHTSDFIVHGGGPVFN